MYTGSVDIRKLLPSAQTLSYLVLSGFSQPDKDDRYVTMFFSYASDLVVVSAE